MAYTIINFPTKKALKEAVTSGQKIRCFQPGLGPPLDNYNGIISLEGPHYPQPHKWYATATLENGIIILVK